MPTFDWLNKNAKLPLVFVFWFLFIHFRVVMMFLLLYPNGWYFVVFLTRLQKDTRISLFYFGHRLSTSFCDDVLLFSLQTSCSFEHQKSSVSPLCRLTKLCASVNFYFHYFYYERSHSLKLFLKLLLKWFFPHLSFKQRDGKPTGVGRDSFTSVSLGSFP